MPIDIPRLTRVRDNMVDALVQWRSVNPDGLWRSKPEKQGHPSYTCTAVAIQALVEAGKLAPAQHVSSALLEKMFDGAQFQPLPSEVDPDLIHILNNSWAVFAVLEALPMKCDVMWPAVKWIIDAQVNGWWSLVPGSDKTSCPIFCAHALAAVTQFFDQAKNGSGIDREKRGLIIDCLENGFSKLLECRTQLGKEHDLLLWPQKIGEPESRISFGVSTMCAHVLDKAGRVLSRPDWSMHVPRTFEELGQGLKKEDHSLNMSVRGRAVNVWDEIHEGPNYFHCVFAPINLVTVLRHLGASTNPENVRYYALIDHFTSWILENSVSEGKGGVLASPQMANVTVWSTAAAIITMSRVIRHGALISRLEHHLMEQSSTIAPDVTLPTRTSNEVIFLKEVKPPEGKSMANDSSSPRVPEWYPIAGALFSAATILFLMYYVLWGGPLEPQKKTVFEVLVAFCAAASATFVGGAAVAWGKIPFFKDSPIVFSAAGGVGTFIVVFLIIHYSS